MLLFYLFLYTGDVMILFISLHWRCYGSIYFSTLAMHFNNSNSDVVKRTGSRKCHIELAMGKAGGNLYIPTRLSL
jgi:hypothetical protein